MRVGSHLIVNVDGVEAWEGDLPANVGHGIMVMCLDINADGETAVGAPGIFMSAPPLPPNPAGCG